MVHQTACSLVKLCQIHVTAKLRFSFTIKQNTPNLWAAQTPSWLSLLPTNNQPSSSKPAGHAHLWRHNRIWSRRFDSWGSKITTWSSNSIKITVKYATRKGYTVLPHTWPRYISEHDVATSIRTGLDVHEFLSNHRKSRLCRTIHTFMRFQWCFRDEPHRLR